MLVAIDDSQPTTTVSEEYWYDADALVTRTQRCVDSLCMMGMDAIALGYVVTGTNERLTDDGKPAHNKGSNHYDGYAIDVRTWDHTDAENEAFIATMRARGYIVKDERVRPANQAVWGGPHIHVESFRWDKLRDAFRALDQFRQ